MKKNLIYIIVFSIYILLIINAIAVNNYEKNRGYKIYKDEIKKCETNNWCEENKKDDLDNCIKYCDDIRNIFSNPTKRDYMYTFFEMFYQKRTMWVQILSPLLIGIIAVWNFLLDFKTGNIKNKLSRITYKKYMLKTWIKSLKFTLILPLFLLILLIASIIVSDGSLNTINESINAYADVGNNYWLLALAVLSIMLQSVLWINVFYIGAKNGKNIVLSIIISYMIYLGIWFLSEVIPAGIMSLSSSNTYDYILLYSLSCIWVVNKPIFTFVYQFLLAFVSTLTLYFVYKDKEEVLIENEI